MSSIAVSSFPGSAFYLRPITADDVQNLVALDADPEVMHYISGGQPTSEAVYRDVLMPRMLAQATPEGLGFFALELDGADGRRFIGWFHLRRDTFEPSWAELGYRLTRAYWGKGLATQVSAQLMARAFGGLGFETVSARTMPDNRASRRVMEKLGMTCQGDFVFPGRNLNGMILPEVPGVLYTRSRVDWEGRQP